MKEATPIGVAFDICMWEKKKQKCIKNIIIT